jgi:hypothetical protein
MPVPRALLNLSDRQLEAVMAASQPLPPRLWSAFLEQVAVTGLLTAQHSGAARTIQGQKAESKQ